MEANMPNRTKKRGVYELQGEIRAYVQKLDRLRETVSWRYHRPVARKREVELMVHLGWLQGYLQAVRDERGLK
jgi:hypothetical protein